MWEEEVSSKMGMSELSSFLLSTLGGPQESLPNGGRQTATLKVFTLPALKKSFNTKSLNKCYQTGTKASEC